MNLVQQIENSATKPAQKVIQLFAVVMLNYRVPLGDEAWAAMVRVTGNPDYCDALSFLMGVTMGSSPSGVPKPEIWKALLPK